MRKDEEITSKRKMLNQFITVKNSLGKLTKFNSIYKRIYTFVKNTELSGIKLLYKLYLTAKQLCQKRGILVQKRQFNNKLSMRNFSILFMAMMIFFPSIAQEKKGAKEVDKHVVGETKREGFVGIPNSIMSDLAPKEKVDEFLERFPDQNYFVFPESRENSIRILNGIPEVWTQRTYHEMRHFNAKARPGEYFVFQIGVYAARSDLKKLSIEYEDVTLGGEVNSEMKLTCFNLEGTNHLGGYFSKTIDVKQGSVQPLWIGVNIPMDASGVFKGSIIVEPKNANAIPIKFNIPIHGNPICKGGFDDEFRLSRLAWLNSTIAQDNKVTNGYIPISRDELTLKILGRDVTIADNGLPQSIQSYFNANNSAFQEKGQPVLNKGFRFMVQNSDGNYIKLKPQPVDFLIEEDAKVEWKVINHAPGIELIVSGSLEFDGFMNYGLKLKTIQDIEIKDISLEIDLKSNMSKYMMGIGKEGGFRPDNWEWKWDDNNSQDAVWLGGVNGGMRIKLKGANYHRQLVNIYYKYHKLNLPKSWCNNKKGGISIKSNTDKTSVLRAYSGKRKLMAGDVLQFDFELLIIPFKLINKDIQFNDRYYHSNSDVSTNFIPEAVKGGANIINIHHKKDINPFINYPYLSENTPTLKKFVKDAHSKNIKTKVYYTTRELTIHIPELWAIKSLNGEIIMPGPGSEAKTVINRKGPHPWLVKNLKDGFIPAWRTAFIKGPYKGRQDLSVVTTPDTRLNNFYLEGLDWMCRNLDIDGIYIDDSALDRTTLMRARKIFDSHKLGSRIDMHSWNHFNKYAGFACSLNLYMDLMPYFDQLWIGEGRDYNREPDYWLVEVSGIPFGLTSQMLSHGGNRWRGMVFGMTNRLGWYGPSPKPIWGFWDTYNILDMEMIGFWDENCPVKSDNPDLVATIYNGKDTSIISVANWTGEDVSGQLIVDWASLGIDPKKAKISLPFISEFQKASNVKFSKQLKVKGKQGNVIVIKN